MELMNSFSEELCWILTYFKNGSINFNEADIQIRELIGRQFGLILPIKAEKNCSHLSHCWTYDYLHSDHKTCCWCQEVREKSQ